MAADRDPPAADQGRALIGITSMIGPFRCGQASRCANGYWNDVYRLKNAVGAQRVLSGRGSLSGDSSGAARLPNQAGNASGS